MTAFAWILSIWLAFSLGYGLKDIRKRVEQIEEEVKDKISKPNEPESLLIDPDDEVQTAMYEAKKLQDKLNGIK